MSVEAAGERRRLEALVLRATRASFKLLTVTSCTQSVLTRLALLTPPPPRPPPPPALLLANSLRSTCHTCNKETKQVSKLQRGREGVAAA